jgi:flagellar hook-associated protein FlgK
VQAGDVFEITINGRTLRYTASARDTNLDQVALQLANLVNANSTLGVTAVNGVGSLQLIGGNVNSPFDVVTTVNGQLPELARGFFEGADRFGFAVNRELLQGRQQLKRNAAVPVVEALTSAERSFQASGLALTNVSYKGLMSALVGASAVNAKTISDAAKTNHDTMQMTEQRYRADVGVNLDEELANLQLLQNAYAASARLLTVIQTLFDTLQAAVTR